MIRKGIAIFLSIFLMGSLAVTVFAAAADTEITLQPVSTENTQGTTIPAEICSLDTSVPTETIAPIDVPTKDREDPTPQNDGLPWWVWTLIALFGAGTGLGTAILLIRKNNK